MDYSTINQARLAHTKAHGARATHELIAQYAPVDEDGTAALSEVDERDWQALLNDLNSGNVAPGKGTRASSIDQLDTKAIWAKFNAAGRHRANQ